MDRRSWKRTGGWSLGLAAAGLLALAPAAGAQEEAPRGEKVYRELCETCHGRYGRGDGPLAKDVPMALPDFTVTPVGAGRTDEELIAQLTGRDAEGHAPMAVGMVLPEPILRDAVAYLRTLGEPGGGISVAAGRDVYRAACAVCHGVAGDGKGPAAKNLPGPAPRDFTDPTFVVKGREAEVAEVIGMGAEKAFHGSVYMPEWSKRLSPQQIRDVVAYIVTLSAAP
jgi:mono/diheme cytochrome c family protein